MGQDSIGSQINMLKLAYRKGHRSELAAFMADMDVTPDWLDMDLVRKGAEHSQILIAHCWHRS